jgi:hypothetical protein
MAEFAVNKYILETTSILPSFANYGLNSKVEFKPDIRVGNPKESQAHTLSNHLSKIYNIIKSEISFTQDQQQEYANRYQLHVPAYYPRDTVCLNARNICTN